MIGALEWLAGLVALGGAGHRAWLWRGGPQQAGGRLLIAFTLSIGLAMGLLAVAGAGVGGAPGAALLLLASELKIAAGCFLVLLALTLGPTPCAARSRRQLVGSAVVLVLEAACYLAAAVTPDGATLTVPDHGRAALTAFNVLFTAHGAWCVAVFTVLVRHAARELPPGPLRAGLRLVVAAGVCGLAWVGSNLPLLLTAMRTGREAGGEDAFSGPVAVLALTLGMGGLALASLDGRTGGPLRRLRLRRDLRRITPLWQALHAVRPEIALAPAGSGGGWGGRAEFVLYRRVIEIRDAQLWLRAHLDPRVPQWAAAACAHEPQPERRAAAVEAAVLAGALAAATAGRGHPQEPAADYLPSAVEADPAAEADWLVLVAEAFVRSPAVDLVRRRVMDELAREEEEFDATVEPGQAGPEGPVPANSDPT
ncbi:MAB_1171c family putative transporter [Kitasatospora sp. NPDC058965]|uniref:MAB_1171c family putative transporter n=1 Tax=Kitasatospora sp. NPDC058965 TaxID=3346682 RepID=UPI0036851B9B